jgi:putative acetyltransferase
MIHIIRTNSAHSDFVDLVNLLDADLAFRDGADHAFYAQYNKIVAINHVVVAYEGDMPVGCGAIKQFDSDSMEVKRMYVLPEKRGLGIAAKILAELESWAGEMDFNRCVLETGKKQPEAIALYNKSGYVVTPNYGQYIGVENSICFEKNVELKNC